MPLTRPLFALALALAAAPAACSSGEASTSSGSAGTGGSTGFGGGFVTSSGAGGVACAYPEPSDAGAPQQSFCAPGAQNDAACPAVEPAADDACAASGLQCAYPTSAMTLVLTTCNNGWSKTLLQCHRDCAPSASAVPVPSTPACGSLPDIGCSAFGATDQQRLDTTVRDLAACCGAPAETQLTVFFADGCATASLGKPELTACFNGLIAGRRITCAAGLSCGFTEWSTLP